MRSHLLEAGEHLSTGKEGADIIQYHLDLLEIPMYVLTLTDVLYRDLEMPGWSAQFSESLRQFDVEYTEHQARKKENARLARNLPFKEEEFKVRL